jgi:Ca2+-transporting ATPase
MIPKESIFDRGLGAYMVRIGLVFSVISITLMYWAYHHATNPAYPGDPERWKTMVFTHPVFGANGPRDRGPV